MMTVGHFAEAVMEFCLYTNASVTCWRRSVLHNKKVGGVDGSPHTHGLGADVVYDVTLPEGTRHELAERYGLKLIIEHDHDHLQPYDWTNRPFVSA